MVKLLKDRFRISPTSDENKERGSGFRRMRDQMLDHGLDQPLLGTDTGYFQVTFRLLSLDPEMISTASGCLSNA